MIDTKKTFERLSERFTTEQADILTDVLKEQDHTKLELQFEQLRGWSEKHFTALRGDLKTLNTKVNVLLVLLPVGMTILGWLITMKKGG